MTDVSSKFPGGAEVYADFLAVVFPDPDSAGRLRELSLPDPAPPVAELEWQARWFAGEFGRVFTSPDGEEIEIVQFGHWNRGAGPDFTEAAVKIDGQLRRGAIEVDLEPQSWESHGHGANPAFDEVVLHVFPQRKQAEAPRFHTRDSRHRSIVQLALDPGVVQPPGRPWGALPEARRGRCASPLRAMAAADLESLLLAAAQYRLQHKARRFTAIAEAHTEGQALFQAVAEALGYRPNKLVMAVLAQRLPLTMLRRHERVEREALLFGVAGFLDPSQFEAAADAEARRYLKALWDHWWKHRSGHEPEPDRRLAWKLSGTRPTNHPQRRVAALAALVNDWQKFRQRVTDSGLSGAAWSRGLGDFLNQLSHDYWCHHYTLKASPSARPLALIGPDRVRDLLGNVLFPAAIPGRLELWEAYLDLPGAAESESLRRARLRLFGEGEDDQARANSWSRRYWQQQALLQIYGDFCLADASECADCPFPEQLGQWRSSNPVRSATQQG